MPDLGWTSLRAFASPCDGTRYMPSDHRTDRAPTTSTTSRAAPPSSGHIDHGPRRPCPERLHRASTTSTTRPRRNDDRHKERRYDNRDHHHNRPKSTRIGQLYRHRSDFYPKISTLLIFIFNIIFITTFLHNILVMIPLGPGRPKPSRKGIGVNTPTASPRAPCILLRHAV